MASPTVAVAARDRILNTADRLFYATGIHAVGVDRIIAEAGVARATFYRHFPTKDDLIAAYLGRRAESARERLTALREQHRDAPERMLLAIADVVDDYRATAGFRGCEFLNAAAEFGDVEHPARRLTVAHRDWVTSFLAGVLADMGHADARETAQAMMMVRTGSLTAAAHELGLADTTVGTRLWNALARRGFIAVVDG